MLELASDTLDGLNARIRKQMQNYHPVLRPGLTPRENYTMLIETVSAAFPATETPDPVQLPGGSLSRRAL